MTIYIPERHCSPQNIEKLIRERFAESGTLPDFYKGGRKMGVVSGRNVHAAEKLKSLGNGHWLQVCRLDQLKTFVSLLEEGCGFYIKYSGGRNITRAFTQDFNGELARIGISIGEAGELVGKVIKFCSRGENTRRFEVFSIELSELAKLDKIGSDNYFFRTFEGRLIEFIEFKALMQSLTRIRETLMFDGAPVNAMARDKVELMLRIINETGFVKEGGYRIRDVALAVKLWKDGELSPNSSNGVVELSDLMNRHKERIERLEAAEELIEIRKRLRASRSGITGVRRLSQLKFYLRLLEKGYKFYIRLSDGRSVVQATDQDFKNELKKIGISFEDAKWLIGNTVEFCAYDEDISGNYSGRLEGFMIKLSELVRLDRNEQSFSLFRTELERLVETRREIG